MSDNKPTFQLPQDWTAEQAEFLSSLLEALSEAIWTTYEDQILRLWRLQDSIPSDYQSSVPPPFDEPLDDQASDIPW